MSRAMYNTHLHECTIGAMYNTRMHEYTIRATYNPRAYKYFDEYKPHKDELLFS